MHKAAFASVQAQLCGELLLTLYALRLGKLSTVFLMWVVHIIQSLPLPPPFLYIQYLEVLQASDSSQGRLAGDVHDMRKRSTYKWMTLQRHQFCAKIEP